VVAPFDSVVICSPTDTHADYVEMAAKAGIHVFCEKPLDLSMQRVVEVLKVVKEANIKLMLGFNRRF
ncbi:MAG TPA: inositol 2-dehydrogenase, partial [Arenibacter sp.]|nr:inositol 2-dehydrogenase [Arenibacter sp.]